MLNSKCQQIWKTQQWPQDWKRSVFIPIPKKGNAKECSNYRTVALISHASKVMLKILQARLQQYVNRELPDVQAGVRKDRGTRDQSANICWILEKAREFQKNIYFCFIYCTNPLTSWITRNCGKFLKRCEYQTTLPFSWETCIRVKKQQLAPCMEQLLAFEQWFKVEKEVWQGCMFSSCLFNLYAEYIMGNSGLKKYRLESRLPGEISITSDMQMTPPLWQKVRKN